MADQYTLGLAAPAELDETYALVRRAWELLEDKDVFAVENLTKEWFATYLGARGFCVTARAADGGLAGVLACCYPGLDEDNLGHDLDYPEQELHRVCLMDIGAVAPEHRGHRLEQRMLIFAEEQLAGTDYVHLLCSVSPHNPASLHSVQKCGYQIMLTKVKYAGHLRHILLKER
ncbi:MAG: hypothetical protein IJ507_03505 [Clostridia bacterium]|nr:hypothetical protein [Clostridia bacterium]